MEETGILGEYHYDTMKEKSIVVEYHHDTTGRRIPFEVIRE